MAWCHQAPSHYLSQCWPRSLSPYGVTRPQWVKSSHCKSFQDWEPVDEIYRRPDIQISCSHCTTSQDTRIASPAMATRWHGPLIFNYLHAKFRRRNINMYLYFVIPPHWHAIDSWNSSSYKTRTYIFYIVNIMVANVLATQGARASATMILT